ncbi:MAG: SLC13 family permease, partial [Hyphomicrobiales bacterium]|nr:SLC13 family permease [Hyphomicrobiales bacterium]
MAGLAAGPIALLAMLLAPLPAGVSPQAWAVAAVGVLMAIWWMTEAVPLATTALLPVLLFPMLDVMDIRDAAASYAHPLIFLFLGGFMLARAMQRWQLHRRIALHVMRLGGNSLTALIFSVMSATAFLSMWVSNTATAM